MAPPGVGESETSAYRPGRGPASLGVEEPSSHGSHHVGMSGEPAEAGAAPAPSPPSVVSKLTFS